MESASWELTLISLNPVTRLAQSWTSHAYSSSRKYSLSSHHLNCIMKSPQGGAGANGFLHCNDGIMGMMASQITSFTIVYSIVYSSDDQIKHQNSASLAFVWGIHRSPVNSPHKGQWCRKCFHLMTSSWALHGGSVFCHTRLGACQTFYIQAVVNGCRHSSCEVFDKAQQKWYIYRIILPFGIHLGPLLLTWFNFNPSMDM